MYIGIIIAVLLIAGSLMLMKKSGHGRRSGGNHPLLHALRTLNIRPGKVEYLLCSRPGYISAGQLMTVREQRFLSQLEAVTDTSRWRLCPQVRVADIVKIAPGWKPRSQAWWQLFRLVSQWHCDIVITDRDGRIVAAVELDDHSHQVRSRRRRDLLLEEVLRQACIPLLRDANAEALAGKVQAYLQPQAVS